MPSTYPNSQYLVINSTDVTATSWVLANGVISINSQNVCKYNAVKKASVTAAVAETPQASNILVNTATSNSVYQIIIQQFNPYTTRTMTQTFTYTSDSTATLAEIVAGLKTQIDAATAAGQLFITTGGASPNITLTAVAGYTLFTVTVIQGDMTASITTPGVVAVGTTAALALKGITVPAGKSYTTVHLEYSPVTGMNIKDDVNLYSVYDLYLDQADAQTAALVTVITNNINGLDNAGAVANPEAIAII